MVDRHDKLRATDSALMTLVVVIAFPVIYALIVTSTLTFQEAYKYSPRLTPGGQNCGTTWGWHGIASTWGASFW